MKSLGLLALIVSGTSILLAQQIPYAQPEDVGMSSAKLREIEQAVGEHLDQGHLAGAVTLVLREGHIVHFETHGWRNLEARTPMTRDSIFRMYSMTKPIVAAAVMMLHDEGKLALDDPVHDHLPELNGLAVFTADGNEPATRPMSIRDLLRHTSGLAYGIAPVSPVDRKYQELGMLSKANDSTTFLKKLASVPLRYQPGERWVYSVSSDVQGVLIERISGQSLDHFLHERLFEPLGMVDTGFYVPVGKRDRLTLTYNVPRDNSELTVRDDPATSAYRFSPKFLSGGSGLVSTALDYAKFAQMMLNGGELFGTRFLDTDTVREMTRNQLPDITYPISIRGETRRGVGFGLGVSVRVEDTDYDPDARIGEYGWGGAAGTRVWMLPEENLAVITMDQTWPDTNYLPASLKGLIYDAIDK